MSLEVFGLQRAPEEASVELGGASTSLSKPVARQLSGGKVPLYAAIVKAMTSTPVLTDALK